MLTRLFTILLLGVVGTFAHGAVVFQLRTFDSGGNASTAFTSGDTVFVRLLATDAAGGAPDFTTQNLSAFQSVFGASGAGASDVNVATGSETINPAFNFPSPRAGSLGNGDRRLGGNAFPSISAPVASPFLLASFNYVANIAGVTNFGFNTSLGTNNTITFANGPINGYDTTNGLSLSGTSVTVSATAVPEPSSMVLLAVAAGGIAYRRKRRLSVAA